MSDSPSMPNLLDLFEIEDGEILDDVQRGDFTGPREIAIDEKTFGDTAKNTDLKSGQNGAGGAGKIVTNSNTRSPPCEEEQSSKRRKFNPSPVSMQVSAPQCHDYVLPLDEMGLARDIMTPMNNREESSGVANHTPQSSSTPLPMRVSAVSYQDNSSACHMRGPVPNWPSQGQAQWQLQTFSPPSANAGYYTYPQGQSFPPPGHNTAHSSSTYSQDHRFPQPGHNAHSSTLPSSAHSSSLPSTAHSSSQPSKSLTVRSVGKGSGKSAYVTRPSTTSVVSKIVSEQPPKQMKMMPAKTVAELVEKKFIVVRSMAFVDSRRSEVKLLTQYDPLTDRIGTTEEPKRIFIQKFFRNPEDATQYHITMSRNLVWDEHRVLLEFREDSVFEAQSTPPKKAASTPRGKYKNKN